MQAGVLLHHAAAGGVAKQHDAAEPQLIDEPFEIFDEIFHEVRTVGMPRRITVRKFWVIFDKDAKSTN